MLNGNLLVRFFKRKVLTSKSLVLFISMVLIVAGCRKVTETIGVPGLCPQVISTNPADSATGVAVDGAISAIFNEPVDSTTLTAATFTVALGSVPVAGIISYSGSTVTFSPTINLARKATYTATLTTGVRDAAHSAMISNYVWTFTTGNGPDIIPPNVTETDPTNMATGVALNKRIAVAFSEVLDSLSATSSFTLNNTTSGGTPVAGFVTYNGTTAIFTPAATLLPNVTYTGTISNLAKDLAGNALATPYTWSFTTGASTDNVPPTVIATVPTDGAANIAVNTKVTAVFSKSMDPASINYTSFTVKQGTNSIPGAVTYSGISATFSPSANLSPNTKYTASITTDARDLAGNTMTYAYVWTFTTGSVFDITAPGVVSTDPINGSIGIAYNKNIAVNFSEMMDPFSVNTASFIIKSSTSSITGTVAYSGTTAIFDPSVDLLPNTKYTVTITTGVKDLAGNAMANDYVFSFTTIIPPDITPPTVVSVNPYNTAINIPVNKTVTGTFSEAMNVSSIPGSFTLKNGSTVIPGAVTYANNDIIFKSTLDLANNTVYTATIAKTVKDLAGNAIVNDFVWTFTTVPATIPPPVLGSISIFGAFGAGGVINDGTNSVVNGSVGSTAASTMVTGFHEGLSGDVYTETAQSRGNVTGRLYTAPPAPGSSTSLTVATQALAGAVAAYNSASPASKPGGTDPNAGELGGLTLAPGIYKAASGTFKITAGDLILDAKGDPNALWIFQTSAGLTIGIAGTGGARSVLLTNGASAANVFWYVGTSATLNPSGGGVITGTVIAPGNITISASGITTQSVVNGRVISLSGTVKMVNTTINVQ
jgi:methionine-rich copper-binding protein CopC